MLLTQAIIKNYRGINGIKTISFNSFNCIIGRNDAGKSTILKALDVFLNESKLSRADFNIDTDDNQLAIELIFDTRENQIFLGEQIATTLKKEELVDEAGFLRIKKVWNVTDTSISNVKTFIYRKKYGGIYDLITKTEPQLIELCRDNWIETSKGNGETYNNVEKREKLRVKWQENSIPYSYEYEDIPSTGSSKIKQIGDSIKEALPALQYFKADTSLSDNDTAIQKFFKDTASNLIYDIIDIAEVERTIEKKLGTVLAAITNKINSIVKAEEKVAPKITYDWSKIVSTSFVSSASGTSIPLSSRGDGFRRITMMSYFEYLAENNRTDESQQIIFGFEEPETFLHPAAQIDLFEKLMSLTENNYQVVISTHSPTIVSSSKTENLIHISRTGHEYNIIQGDIDFKELAKDLGIKPDNTFTPLFSTSKLLFLVEGIDDVQAMHHLAKLYKENNLIQASFKELDITIIPLGGCDSVQHWVNLDLFTKLSKPYFIFLDSDTPDKYSTSPNQSKLLANSLIEGQDFLVSRKRSLENYIHHTALKRLVPKSQLSYGDFDHVKNLCKAYPDDIVRGLIGGKNVTEKHFCSLNFDEVRMTWNGEDGDEFLHIYSIIVNKLR
ncbi:ATP-dependent nuclease [Xanthocytophaga flava]|uniref:ATP-dependent nuclease n=1 Tax=Xanthocytophaga flava TaxID=3048013 RepID=UPI0028D1EDC8|nr:AAA family ATPase [Xanthocytophaga flavus]MDJ1466959.1 AAA family ATPase [Xanthocytophaga flavus]